MKGISLRILALFSVTAGLAPPLAAQTLVTASGPATNATGLDGAVLFDLGVSANLTLTQIEFETGPATPAGAVASVDVWLIGWQVGNRTAPQDTFSWVRVGSTVPVTIGAGGVATVTAALVPAAPFAAVTLPMGSIGVALVANGCELGTQPGSATSVNADLFFSGRFSQAQFLDGAAAAGESFVGALTYTIGGAPLPLGDVESFGAGCQGLTVAVTGGAPVRGSTLALTTSGPTLPGVGLCLLADRPVEGTLLPPGIGIDLSFFGAPGCPLFVDADQSIGLVLTNAGPGAGLTVPFAIANVPQLFGLSLYVQSAWLEGGQFFGGLSTSNALRIRIG